MENDKQQTILIVEDEPALLNVYADELGDEGFRVLKASNGQEGLEYALREKPDLILLDILMPIMDGITMMGKLREKNEYGKTVPIILLTNLSASEEKTIKAIAEDKPVHYLIKSDWSLRNIIGKIREQLHR